MTKRRRRKVRLHKPPMPAAGHQPRPRGALRHPERTTLRTNITIIRRRPRFTPRPTYCLWAPKFPCERKKRSIQPQRPKGRPMRLKSPTMFSTPTATWSFPVVQTLRSSFDRPRREPAFMAPPTLCWICNRFRVGGKQYLVSTTDLQQKGKQGFGANKRTAEFTGGGAALGAIIGAIAGGGKGAAIGAGAGAGAGAVTQVATKGGAIRVPAEMVLTFQLDKPVQIVEAK